MQDQARLKFTKVRIKNVLKYNRDYQELLEGIISFDIIFFNFLIIRKIKQSKINCVT
eukprot:UN26910